MIFLRYLLLVLLALSWTVSSAQPAITVEDLLAEAESALAAAKSDGTSLLSPRRVAKAEESLNEARKQMSHPGSEQLVRLNLESCLESLETAVASTASVRERLKIVLDARSAAIAAGAETYRLPSWEQAERGLTDMTGSIETGRDAEVDGLREPLAVQYRTARRDALREDILAAAKSEIILAEQSKCDEMFPTLMARARQEMSRAETQLAQENHDESRAAANKASFHARHARGQMKYVTETSGKRAPNEALLLPYDDLLEEMAAAWSDSVDFGSGGGAAVEKFRQVYERGRAKDAAERDSILRTVDIAQSSMERSLAEMQTRFADVQNQIIEHEQRVLDIQAERDVAVSRLRKNELTAQRVQIAQTAFDPGDAVVYQTMDGHVVIHLYGLKFASGKATLSKEHQSILKKASEAIGAFPDVTVSIEGHTDDEGSEDSNLELSEERAAAVGQALAKELGGSKQVTTVGKGESAPIASNKSARGKALNRRIDLVLTLP